MTDKAQNKLYVYLVCSTYILFSEKVESQLLESMYSNSLSFPKLRFGSLDKRELKPKFIDLQIFRNNTFPFLKNRNPTCDKL